MIMIGGETFYFEITTDRGKEPQASGGLMAP
jgi:hypothetical protein